MCFASSLPLLPFSSKEGHTCIAIICRKPEEKKATGERKGVSVLFVELLV